MNTDLNRAITQIIQDCPSAAHVIQAELKKRVEVVRCKECKHSGMYAFGTGSELKLACLEIEEDGFIRFATSVDPNDFCSYGERKENA